MGFGNNQLDIILEDGALESERGKGNQPQPPEPRNGHGRGGSNHDETAGELRDK